AAETLSSPFTSSEVRYEGLHIISLSNVHSGERVEIVPSLGGMINELLLQSPGGLSSLLFGDQWSELRANPMYRGRLLFPFCCRIPGGRYTFQGKTYKFPINRPQEHSALHG